MRKAPAYAARVAASIAAASTLMVASVAAAQRVAPGPAPVSTAATPIRDGGLTWWAERDDAEPTRVTVYVDDRRPFSARVDRHAIVRLAPGVDAAATFSALGVVPVREIAPALSAWRIVDAGPLDGLDLAARLAPQTGPGRPLSSAIPDWILVHRTSAIRIPPDDPRYVGQWFLDRIEIEDAWRMSIGDPSTTIVIVDSGCDAAHEDLAPNLDPGRDVIDGDDDPSPSAESGNEHGTACAGLAAAVTDNATGIAGVCPECRLRCVRLLDGTSTPVPISADVEAFQFALDVDAAVVSNSWGVVEPSSVPSVLRAMIEAVVDSGRGGRGAIVLFAAGNDNREIFDYELQGVRGVVTIGAVNNFDEATAYSNRGASVAIVAPTGTLTTDISGPSGADPGDYTPSFGGTSSACPIAAGVAGLLASASPESTGAEISDALVSTALPSPFATPDEAGHDLLYGHGRIAPAAALRRVLGLPDPTLDAGAPTVDAGSMPPAETEGCGCAVPSTRGSGAGGAALGVLALLLVVRRRARPLGR